MSFQRRCNIFHCAFAPLQHPYVGEYILLLLGKEHIKGSLVGALDTLAREYVAGAPVKQKFHRLKISTQRKLRDLVHNYFDFEIPGMSSVIVF